MLLERTAQLVIYAFLKNKLKNFEFPENTKPGPGVAILTSWLKERTPMLEQRSLMIEMLLVVMKKSLEK